MEHPHYEAHSFKTYESRDNQLFRESLIELVKIGFAAALHRDAVEGHVGPETQAGAFYETDKDEVVEYGFFARPSTGEVTITATVSKDMDILAEEDMDGLPEGPEAVAAVIAAEVQASEGVPDAMKKYFLRHPLQALQLTMVDQFMRREFTVRLDEGSAQVKTSMGYKVNGYEVAAMESESAPNEFEEQRKTLFDKDDLFEVTNALYTMGLVTPEQVQRFLDKDF